MTDLIINLHQDPFIMTILCGLVWPLIQAVLDKPWWTRERRIGILVVVALVVTAGVWVAGVYPATWRLLTAQLSVFLGVTWSVYQVLASIKINGWSLLDWVGAVTPGGANTEDLTGGGEERIE